MKMTDFLENDAVVDGLIEFLTSQRLIRKDQKLEKDESLLDAGIIDSLAIMELTNYIEAKFGIWFEEQDLIPETFESLGSLADYITTKQSN
jgi:acyl carrier protein